MFCDDSRGTQVDHFWPMGIFPQQTFVWENFLWVCSGCNLIKGSRFCLDENGEPLLIDPTIDDPWEFLYFDAQTGLVTARFVPQTKRPHPKGEHTCRDDILPLNIEAVTEGRRRTMRCLRRAVERCIQGLAEGSECAKLQGALIDEIEDHDDYGLAEWCFLRDGVETIPFSTLRARHTAVWQDVVSALTSRKP